MSPRLRNPRDFTTTPGRAVMFAFDPQNMELTEATVQDIRAVCSCRKMIDDVWKNAGESQKMASQTLEKALLQGKFVFQYVLCKSKTDFGGIVFLFLGEANLIKSSEKPTI